MLCILLCWYQGHRLVTAQQEGGRLTSGLHSLCVLSPRAKLEEKRKKEEEKRLREEEKVAWLPPLPLWTLRHQGAFCVSVLGQRAPRGLAFLTAVSTGSSLGGCLVGWGLDNLKHSTPFPECPGVTAVAFSPYHSASRQRRQRSLGSSRSQRPRRPPR